MCPAGQQYNAANGSCVLCPQGYWKKDSLRFDKCEQCPENYTTVGQGSTDSTNCSISKLFAKSNIVISFLNRVLTYFRVFVSIYVSNMLFLNCMYCSCLDYL